MGCEHPDHGHTAPTIPRLLIQAAQVHGTAEAARDGELRVTWSEFAARVAGRAAQYAHLGVGRGDRVAVLADNGLAFLEAYFAVAAVGAVSVPLNVRLVPRELAGVLEDAEPVLLLAQERYSRVAREAATLISGAIELQPLAQSPDATGVLEPGPAREGDLAHLYYTSGTTGRPKGVMLSHRNVCQHALAAACELSLAPTDTWAHIAPMFHLADAWASFAITLVGGRHVFLERFEAGAALDLMERERATITNLVPTMLGAMVARTDAAARDWSRLRSILSGGAPIAPEVVRAIVATFRTEYVQTYGMTETSPYLTLSKLGRAQAGLSAEERLALSARTGRPFLGIELQVVDADGARVPADDTSVGEIRVRGATVTAGYWRQPEATAQALRDGWLWTGDLARVDRHGFVEIVDRAKDMILTGGENVYSIEVENVLYEHPDVLEAAAFGRPDVQWGEAVWAAVVPREGRRLDAAALIAHCRGRLAGFKVPKGIDLLEALPRTGSGKIAKRLLRDGI
ncbi:long-chain-fatty-acid--CoA ligase [Engelhardtia mirabilis]